MPVYHSVLNVKALVGAFNHEKALVEAFSVIVKPMDRLHHPPSITPAETSIRSLSSPHPPAAATSTSQNEKRRCDDVMYQSAN